MSDLIDRINELGPLAVAARLGLEVKPARRIDPCPACGRSEKRGAVWLELSGRWRCGCGAGGRAVDLVMAREGLTALGREGLEAIERVLGESSTWERAKAAAPVMEELPSMTPRQIGGWWNRYTYDIATGDDCRAVYRWLRLARGIQGDLRCAWWGVIRQPRDVPRSRPDIRAALEAGPACCWALRTTHPDRRGEIRNIQVRPIRPTLTKYDLADWHPPLKLPMPRKNTLMVKGPGSGSDGLWPLCYGHPRELERANLLIVEGGCDWMTARSWMGEQWAVLGAYCAGDIRARWGMVVKEYPGRVVVVPHLDDVARGGGRAGPDACLALVGQHPRVELFDWRSWWAACGARSSDINDMVRATTDGGRGVSWDLAGMAFRGVVG